MRKIKIKRCWFYLKKWLKENRFIIYSCIIIFLFPIFGTIFYRIPCIEKLDIKGDVLQFYAVTFGLLITCVQYRSTKEEQIFLSQQSLKPKISLNLDFDDDEMQARLEIFNNTENDYKIVYICLDLAADEKKYNLNAKDKTVIIIEDYWNEGYPDLIDIQLEDTDGNSWSVGFERQEDGSKKYYRSYIDAN